MPVDPQGLARMLMGEWDKTLQPLKERAKILPFGQYKDGSVGLSWPGLLAAPAEGMVNFGRYGYDSPEAIADNARSAFDVAGGAVTGGLGVGLAGGLADNAVGSAGGKLTHPQGIRNAATVGRINPDTLAISPDPSLNSTWKNTVEAGNILFGADETYMPAILNEAGDFPLDAYDIGGLSNAWRNKVRSTGELFANAKHGAAVPLATQAAERQGAKTAASETSLTTGRLANSLEPIPPQSAQTAGDPLAHMLGGSEGQSGRVARSSIENDQHLAEIASQYGLLVDGPLSPHIARALSDPGPYHYGIRTKDYATPAGEVMADGRQWYQDAAPVPYRELSGDERQLIKDSWLGELSLDEIRARDWDPNYIDHDMPLGGASAVDFLRPDRDPSMSDISRARTYNQYGSNGDFVHLVRSRTAWQGTDDGEIVMEAPEVLAVAPFAKELFANAPTGAALPLGLEAQQETDVDPALMEVLRQYGLMPSN